MNTLKEPFRILQFDSPRRTHALRVVVMAFLLLFGLGIANTEAASIKCMLGLAKCIKSQGTEIPSSQVIEILDLCEDFTRNDVGAYALKMSLEDVQKRSGGKRTLLMRAWFSYEGLHRSPLDFERKRRAEDVRYLDIKRACNVLKRDFYNDSKWTR